MMHAIMLCSLTEFYAAGSKFKLPNRLVRYIEFDRTAVFLLDKNSNTDKESDRYKIVAVKFSQEGGINHLYIAWEFQIIDEGNFVHNIEGMSRGNFNNEEVVICHSHTFDTQFTLSTETGEVLAKIPIKI